MAYADVLTSILASNSNVAVVTAEARLALKDIPELYADRFCDVGIAEQNLIGLASGLAAMGKIVFAHAPLCGFASMRAFEHIRTTAAMQGYNVKIPGFMPGFSVAFQGPTHVTLEDLSIMRSIAGMTVMSTASMEELKLVMDHAIQTPGCVYFQAAEALPDKIEYENVPGPIDKPRIVRTGKVGLVIAIGGMVRRSIEAIEMAGLDLTLVNLSILKPAPVDELVRILNQFDRVATVEEHFITGGLGSTTAEIIADAGLSKHLRRIGVADAFPDRYSTQEANLEYIGLDARGIAAQLKGFFA